MYPLTSSPPRRSETELPARLPLGDRLVVLLSGLLVMAGGFAGLGMGLFGWDGAAALSRWAAGRALQGRAVEAAAGAALALVGAAAIRPAFSRLGYERSIVRATGLGEVHVTLRAIQTLARRAAAQVQGIREADVEVYPAGAGDVNVRVAVTVAPDHSIPEICDEVQTRIDQYLRQTAGVSCGQVRVLVRGVARDGHRHRAP